MGITLRWDITDKCSLGCVHCYNASVRSNNNSIGVSYKEIIKSLPSRHIEHIKLMGGEPFECSNITEICKMLSEKNIKFGITTNGMFVRDEKYYQVITNKHLCYFTFSIDGIDEEASKTFRVNSNINHILENIKKIREYRIDIKIAIIMILNKVNYKNIETYIRYFEELGVDKICLSALTTDDEELSKLKCTDEEYKWLINKLENIMFKIKVQLNFSCNTIINKNSKLNMDYNCQAGRKSGYIDWNGNLYPCGAAINNHNLYEEKSLTKSLLQESFWNIWFSDEFNDIYNYCKKFSKGEIGILPNKCSGCCEDKEKCMICYYYSNSSVKSGEYCEEIDYLRRLNPEFRISICDNSTYLYNCLLEQEFNVKNFDLGYIVRKILSGSINSDQLEALDKQFSVINYRLK